MELRYWLAGATIILIILLIVTHIKNYEMNPKIIWTYWDNPDKMPKAVSMCMETWRKYNPNYQIVLLTKNNYASYMDIPAEIVNHPNFNDSPARFSDLLRLYALATRGGVWIDSSILLKSPLDSWLFPRPVEFSGFYIDIFSKPGLPPVIESWFLACTKNSEFVKLWCAEFSEMSKFKSVKEYVESRKAMGVDVEKIDNPEYLAIHVSAQKVLQVDKYPLSNLVLRRAEDGPYKYLTEASWDSAKGLELACKNKSLQGELMKMRSHERNILENFIDSELSPAKCGWLT
jgi:hypothetical protein